MVTKHLAELRWEKTLWHPAELKEFVNKLPPALEARLGAFAENPDYAFSTAKYSVAVSFAQVCHHRLRVRVLILLQMNRCEGHGHIPVPHDGHPHESSLALATEIESSGLSGRRHWNFEVPYFCLMAEEAVIWARVILLGHLCIRGNHHHVWV